jgi:hypothetical protein
MRGSETRRGKPLIAEAAEKSAEDAEKALNLFSDLSSQFSVFGTMQLHGQQEANHNQSRRYRLQAWEAGAG